MCGWGQCGKEGMIGNSDHDANTKSHALLISHQRSRKRSTANLWRGLPVQPLDNLGVECLESVVLSAFKKLSLDSLSLHRCCMVLKETAERANQSQRICENMYLSRKLSTQAKSPNETLGWATLFTSEATLHGRRNLSDALKTTVLHRTGVLACEVIIIIYSSVCAATLPATPPHN